MRLLALAGVATLVALGCGGPRAAAARRVAPASAEATAVAQERSQPAATGAGRPAIDAGAAAGCVDDAERACMAAGVSQLGRASPETRFEERPPRGARLAAFAVDRREVAADAYAHCAAAGRCREPHCDDGHAAPSSGPVACVAWDDARAFCAWRGGRLPTEAEWERVAAGLLPEHRAYPWGDDAGEAPDGAPTADDTTPDGVHDLGGGVAEWVDEVGAFYLLPARHDAGGPEGGAADASAPPPASSAAADQAENELADASLPEQTSTGMPIVDAPRGPREGVWRVVRGGSAGGPLADWTSTRRRFRLPDDRRAWIGFRCAYDVGPARDAGLTAPPP